MEALPVSVEELIVRLDTHFRPPRISPKESWEDALYKAGQRSVVDFLIRLRDQPPEVID